MKLFKIQILEIDILPHWYIVFCYIEILLILINENIFESSN